MKSPLRILFLNHDCTVGGAEKALLGVLRTIDRDRFTPEVWVRQRSGTLLSAYDGTGIPVLERPFAMREGRRRRLLWSAVRAGMQMKRFDIVHSFCTNAWWTEPAAIALARGPAYVINKSDHYAWGPGRSWRYREETAGRIIAVSRTIFESRYRGTPLERKAVVIRNGIDVEKFRPAPPGGRLRCELGIAPSQPLFGCVGNLSPYKGQIPVLVALAAARAQGLVFHVAFAGRDLCNGEVQRWARSLGVTDLAHFAGEVDDIAEFHSDCIASILLSPTEATSLAVSEALACGKPMIVTDTGAAEIVQDGVSGFVVPVGDIVAVIDRMKQLTSSESLRTQMSEAGRRRVLEGFSLRSMCEQYENLWLETVEGRKNPGRDANVEARLIQEARGTAGEAPSGVELHAPDRGLGQ